MPPDAVTDHVTGEFMPADEGETVQAAVNPTGAVTATVAPAVAVPPLPVQDNE